VCLELAKRTPSPGGIRPGLRGTYHPETRLVTLVSKMLLLGVMRSRRGLNVPMIPNVSRSSPQAGGFCGPTAEA